MDRPPRIVKFHKDRQDTQASGWQRLLELIEEAAEDRREEFKPLTELSPEHRRQIVTLPPTIGKLTAVRHLVLYRSNLVRIPSEIGMMTSLEEFTPYTSYRLHWFPYELTRCAKLKRSTVSTRALYGNYKYRPPFPELISETGRIGELLPATWGAAAIQTCSVCDAPIGHSGPVQAWIPLRSPPTCSHCWSTHAPRNASKRCRNRQSTTSQRRTAAALTSHSPLPST